MSKLDWILLFVMPPLQTAAQLLADRDANSTGADDEAAEAIRYAIDRLQKFQAKK
jgi:hypothetical protein